MREAVTPNGTAVDKKRRIFGIFLLGTAVAVAAAFFAFSGPTGDIPVLRKDAVVTAGPPQPTSGAEPVLKVAIGAMISPKDTEIYYKQLLDYLGRSIGARVELVQRKTYAEINSLLAAGEIQLAFICSGPYVLSSGRQSAVLLTTPQVQGRRTYQSYLIVSKDSAYNSLDDLRGKTFAFTDPDSNTGSLVPRFWLAQRGASPKTWFKETIFTYSHDNSIYAVAKGLVDGAAVDSLIWDFYEHNKSEITAGTRIIKRSEEYGIPPVVASPAVSEEQRNVIRTIMLNMHAVPEGKKILNALLIDRFILPQDDWYGSIRQMQQDIQQTEQP